MGRRYFASLLALVFASIVSRVALAAPTIEINGTDVTSALCGSESVCRGTDYTVAGNYELNSWDFLLQPDPSITSSFTLTNLSSIKQTFFLTVTLPVVALGSPVSISGSVGTGTLTDVNGGGATLTDVGPSTSIYEALIDGSSVQTLLDPPQTFSVISSPSGGPGSPVSIGPESFGPTFLAQSVNSSIGMRLGFTLTAGDSVYLPETFGVIAAVPEPTSYAMLLAGLGLMEFVMRRRQQHVLAA